VGAGLRIIIRAFEYEYGDSLDIFLPESGSVNTNTGQGLGSTTKEDSNHQASANP
jgi:hypothetical protein